ncbi:glycosyl hydrolase family 95 catalytic domain-containing protein [Diplocloster hominis]|uniref:glycosyl hydrolase family 95 catalytic domain-containing protein n=1 Tax=Diplocloster hominis TaxID=3079010 RepID=UPI0031BAB1F7
MLTDAYREGISDEERLAIFKKVEAQTKKIWDAPCNAQSTFLPLGRMILDFPELTSGTTDYSRVLDMDGAASEVSFKKDGVTYSRQAFISNPDNVMAVKLENDGGQKMKMNVTLELPSQMVGKADVNKVTVDQEKNEIVMTGRAPIEKYGNQATWHEDRGTTFEARVKVLPVNGTMTVSGNSLQVADADEIVLLYTCETSYKDFKTDPARSGIDVSGNVRRSLDAAVQKGYDKLLEDHQTDFRSLFRRLWIDMDGNTIKYGNVDITPFEYARHFQYGRYIALCCERENSQAAQNLLGIWNASWSPANQSAYYLNENIQKMSAIKGPGNLADTSDALFKLLESFADETTGGKTAQTTYGAAEGAWVVAHSTDIWAKTAMWGDAVEYGSWTSGGMWALDSLYDKYDFTQDIELLKKYYPIMEGAARFALSTLTQVDGVNGELKDYLVIAPAGSPEHWYKLSGGGKASFDISTAADVEIYNNLFHMMESGAEALDEAGVEYDRTLLADVLTAREKMVPLELFIDLDTGRLKEWYNEYTTGDAGHRHASHLLGIFMNHSGINEADTPALYYAAQEEGKRLFSRGGGQHPDRATMSVRLGDPQTAFSAMPHGIAGTNTSNNDWRYWCPVSNSVAEAILDSRFDELNLMENIPDQWSSGTIKGIRGRGGYQLSMEWADGELVSCTIDSPSGATPRVLYKGKGVNLSEDPRFQVNRAALSLEELIKEASQKLNDNYTKASKDALQAALEINTVEALSQALLAMVPVNGAEHEDFTIEAQDGRTVLCKAGETVQLSVKDGQDIPVRWSMESLTDNMDANAIAGIDENGVVTAVSGGRVRVTAEALDGSRATGTIDLLMELPVLEKENVDDRDPRITYNGSWVTWEEAKHMNGTITNSEPGAAPGSTASLTFNGSGIEFITSTGGHIGGIRVTIDDKVVEPQIDLNFADGQAQYLGFSKMDLEPGEHTITITTMDTAGKTRVDVDAFNIYRSSPAQTDRSGLLEAYNSYRSMENNGSYQEDVWADFQSALTDASSVLWNLDSTQQEIEGALSALRAAHKALGIHTENIDDRDSRIHYTGSWVTWDESKHMNGTVTNSKNAGDKAALTFTGTGIEFITSTGGHLGSFCVTLDGQVVENEISVNVQDGASQYVGYSNRNLANTEHTIEITSMGGSGKGRIDVDAFIVYIDTAAGMDSTGLREACERYGELENDNYTPAGWENFQQALAAAGSTLVTAVTQKELDDALDALEAAYLALERKADKTQLSKLIEECNALNEEEYVPESWAAFQIVLGEISPLLTDENLSQSAANKAYNRLLTARLALERTAPPLNTTELSTLIDQAAAIDTTNLRPGKVEELNQALDYAKEIFAKAENGEAGQDDINSAADALLQAIVNLKEIADRADLTELIGLLEKLDGNDYTPASYEALISALNAARLINDDSSEADILKAYQDLQNSFSQLIRDTADKSALANALEKAAVILGSADSFMPGSIAGLQGIYDSARSIYDDPAAAQEQVDQVTAELTAANAKAKVKEEKEVLFNAIQRAGLYKAENYTPESYSLLGAAIMRGRSVAENGDATKDQIDQAVREIEDAVAGLVEVPAGNDDNGKPGLSDEGKDNKDTDNDSDNDKKDSEDKEQNTEKDPKTQVSFQGTYRRPVNVNITVADAPDSTDKTKGASEPSDPDGSGAESSGSEQDQNGNDTKEPKEAASDAAAGQTDTDTQNENVQKNSEGTGVLPVAVGILLLLLIIAAIWYFYKKKQK